MILLATRNTFLTLIENSVNLDVMRITLSLTKPTRITFLRVILVCQKFRLFLVDFSKSNSRLRKVILGSARILLFSLACEKSNSRTDENCHIRGEKHMILRVIIWSENHARIILSLSIPMTP